MKDFAHEFASLDDPDEVHSSHALDVLAEIYGEQDGRTAEATKAYELLANRYDPIRANYWNYKKATLTHGNGVAAA